MLRSYLSLLFIYTINLNIALNAEIINNYPVTVEITQGTLGGKTFTTEEGVTYYGFEGIPYAQPPIGELRFKAPQQPPVSWEGVRDATVEGNICTQMGSTTSDIVGSEDCLFLNVFTTELPSAGVTPNLTVMVWIHGGGFSVGSGNMDPYGADFLMNTGDLVLVSINYRLGALGFLGLDHPVVSKNNGLKDQVAALKWVQINIDKFGGNPDDVTIFGESAGAGSVHHQLLSPLSEGLFHKAISESGSVLSSWTYTDPQIAHERALSLGDVLSLNSSDVHQLLQSLLIAKPDDIVTAQLKIPVPPSEQPSPPSTVAFGPTKEESDNAFLPDSPINIIKAGKFHQVPYINGVNTAEGKSFALDVHFNSSLWPFYNKNFEEIFVPQELGFQYGSPESLQIAAQIKEMYFGNQSLSDDTLAQYVDLQTDAKFNVGAYRAINLQILTGNSPVYFYTFSYLGNLSTSIVGNYNYPFPGAAHGDEVSYLLKMYYTAVDKNSTDAQVVQHMTKLWTKFAKTGNPTLDMEVSWKPLNNESKTYINIDAELTVEDYNNFRSEEMALWTDLFKNIDEI